MNRNLRLYVAIFSMLFALGDFAESYGQQPDKNIEITGVYGSPEPFWKKGHKLENLGVNSIFVHSRAITDELMKKAKAGNLKVFAEFATLNGKNYVETHPEAWALNEKGEKVAAASWFMGVCPTDPGFLKYRLDVLQKLLDDFELDGVWLDYIHWHAQFEEPDPILPETCFSDSCLNSFSKTAQITLPKGSTAEKASWILNNKEKEWRDWRCGILYSWVKQMREIVKKSKPEALLGLYHCPWTDEEFNGARRRILGLDYDQLKNIVDVFSPMVYHQRMGRDPSWVAENVKWLSDRLGLSTTTFPKIWPIVQAHNDPGIVSANEFETVMWGGLSGKSTGIMMFTTRSVAEEDAKIEVMKKVYLAIDSLQSKN